MSKRLDRISNRSAERYTGYRDLAIVYEGRSAEVPVRVPDLSVNGMFINMADPFPEGAIIKVRFVLNRSQFEVNVRTEVRYCLPGVGIGVEFLDITQEAQDAIRDEFEYPRQRRQPAH